MTNIPEEKFKDGDTISFKAQNDGFLCANNINKVSLSTGFNEQDHWKVEQVGASCFAFKSVHDKYLRANCNGTVDLSFDRREHEIWIVEQKGSSYFAFKSCFGNYLRANDSGVVDLFHLCHNSELWLIEEISLNLSPNDFYSFSTHHNEPYIQLYPREYLTPNYHCDYIQYQPAKPLSPLPQVQNQPTQNDYQPSTRPTSFELHPQVNPNIYLHNGRIVTLKSYHGTYLSGNKNMTVNLSTFIGEWEKWKLETHQNKDNETMIAFKSVHGAYLRAESSKKLMLSYVCGDLERFSSEYKDGYFYFKSSHGTYLRAETNCDVTLGKHANHFEQWRIN